MFGIGFNELIVIFVIVVIFIRPQDLPKLFRTLGKWYGDLKRAYNELVEIKDKMVKDVKDAVDIEAVKPASSTAESPAAQPPVPSPEVTPEPAIAAQVPGTTNDAPTPPAEQPPKA